MQGRQVIVDHIISDIKGGEIEDGDSLSQRKIVARYGCGRWIAMRVLEELAASSWLDEMPDGTYTVAETSTDTLRQALELRVLLEIYGATAVMPIMNDAYIRRLWTINVSMWKAGKLGNFARAVSLNRDFHTCLTEAADHGPLSRQLGALYQLQGFSDADNFQTERHVFHSMCEHARMIIHLKNKHSDGLARVIRRHVLNNAERLF